MSQISPEIVTFGCRLNSYESEAIRAHAIEAGLNDLVVINTCAVTSEAVRQARQAIRRARREHPDALLIVTGCAAQIDPYPLATLSEVDMVVGNDLKMKPETYREIARRRISGERGDKILVNDIHNIRETASPLVHGFEGKTRAFVQIQNGCDHACTYCVIRLGRGPSRSVPMDTILAQVRTLAATTYPEIALTGVDITSYGADLPDRPRLGHLVRRVLAETPVKRLRLSSLDPAAIDEDLWHALATEPRLMPHLHLSLQAGDDTVLKRMRRRHTSDDVRALCDKARKLRPDIAFGADLIAGFPTETDEMFENTRCLLRETGIVWQHIFPYSARPHTAAAKMPQIPGPIRRARAKILREDASLAVAAHLDAQQGRTLTVHIEQPHTGRADDFTEVRLDEAFETGDVARVFCYGRKENVALGRKI